MHKALKKQQERCEQRIIKMFYDHTIQVEQQHFSLRWTNIFAQAASRLDAAGYPVELIDSASRMCLNFRSFYMQKWQLQLNREYEDEPLLILAYASFEPEKYVKKIEPVLEQTELLCQFSRFSGQVRYHPLSGTDEEMISFIYDVAIKLHLAFNK